MTSEPNIQHNSGRRRVVERTQPRRSKRNRTEHVDRYATDAMTAKLAELAEHFNGDRDRG